VFGRFSASDEKRSRIAGNGEIERINNFLHLNITLNISEMKLTTVNDCKIIDLRKIHDVRGNLTPIEGGVDVPFDIKRIYYLYDVPGGESRGAHAHKQLHQLIVAASGSFTVTLDDGKAKKVFALNRSYYGLLVVPGIWRDLNDFSSGAVLLCLASEHYQADDYIRDYEEFLKYKN
jgi:hypothetical protein